MGKDLTQRSGGIAGVIQCGSSVRAVVLFGGNEVDVTAETEFPLLAEFLGRFRQSVQLGQGDTGNLGRMLQKWASDFVPLRRIDPDASKNPLQRQFDDFLALSDHIGPGFPVEQNLKSRQPVGALPMISRSQLTGGHSSTTSPGSRSGLYSQ